MTLPSLETASFWANIAVVTLTVLAALSGVFAWYFSSRLGSARDTVFNRFKTESEKRIADANEGTAKALENAASLNERAGRLELEAAKQRERAANAERSFLELQNRISPRHLAPEQRTNLIAILTANLKGEVKISCIAGNPESCEFADELVAALRASGWTVEFSRGVMIFGATPVGLLLQIANRDNPPPRIAVLQEALRRVGLNAPAQVSATVPEGGVELIVGNKE